MLSDATIQWGQSQWNSAFLGLLTVGMAFWNKHGPSAAMSYKLGLNMQMKNKNQTSMHPQRLNNILSHKMWIWLMRVTYSLCTRWLRRSWVTCSCQPFRTPVLEGGAAVGIVLRLPMLPEFEPSFISGLEREITTLHPTTQVNQWNAVHLLQQYMT